MKPGLVVLLLGSGIALAEHPLSNPKVYLSKEGVRAVVAQVKAPTSDRCVLMVTGPGGELDGLVLDCRAERRDSQFTYLVIRKGAGCGQSSTVGPSTMTTQTADGVVGSTLGPFKITKVIGRGGMGTVYLGEHSVIGSRVAIKVLQDKLASDEGLVARFYAEARAVNLIGHENIVARAERSVTRGTSEPAGAAKAGYVKQCVDQGFTVRSHFTIVSLVW